MFRSIDGTVLWARAVLGANIRDYSFAFRAVAQAQLDDDDEDEDEDATPFAATTSRERQQSIDGGNSTSKAIGGVVVLAFVQG